MPLQQISVSTVDWNKEISSGHQAENWKIPEPVFTTSGLGDPKMERCPSQSSTLSNNNDICRICHCEGDSEAPLIAPCYCAGSLRYVHQACLQQWIKSSDIRCCELCKFTFIMQSKLKPVNQWERLGMSPVERRKLLCSVVFHAVALACVVWSLYILIDRTADEMHRGVLEWPFWTKLVVVAIGFTGGVVFMYIQCKVYLHLCRRWRAFNRVIYVQDAPEKVSLAETAQESYVAQNCCGVDRRTDSLLVPHEPSSRPCSVGPRPANVPEMKAFFVDETRPAEGKIVASGSGNFREEASGDSEECSRLLGSSSSKNMVVPAAKEGGFEIRRHGSAPCERAEVLVEGAEKSRSLGSQSPLLVQRLGESGEGKCDGTV